VLPCRRYTRMESRVSLEHVYHVRFVPTAREMATLYLRLHAEKVISLLKGFVHKLPTMITDVPAALGSSSSAAVS